MKVLVTDVAQGAAHDARGMILEVKGGRGGSIIYVSFIKDEYIIDTFLVENEYKIIPKELEYESEEVIRLYLAL